MHPEIDKLINLALENGISEKEREILIKKAESLGLDRFEFELYLESKIETSSKQPQKKDLKSCPKCGSNIPLISKVCSYCNYVFPEDDTKKITIDTLIERFNKNIYDLKLLPKLNVFRTLFIDKIIITIPLLVVYFFILGLVSKIGIFFVPLFFLIGFFVFAGFLSKVNVRLPLNQPKRGKHKITHKHIRAAFEENKKLASIYYGENIEVKNLIKQFSDEYAEIEIERLKNKKNTTIISLIMVAVLIIVLLIPYGGIRKRKAEKFKTEMSMFFDYNKNVQPYDTLNIGQLSDFAHLKNQEIEIKYSYRETPFHKHRIYCDIDNVIIEIDSAEEKLHQPNHKIKLEFELVFTDASGKIIENFHTFSNNTFNEYYQMLKEGKGEIKLDFASSEYRLEEKEELQKYLDIFENEVKYYMIKSNLTITKIENQSNNK